MPFYGCRFTHGAPSLVLYSTPPRLVYYVAERDSVDGVRLSPRNIFPYPGDRSPAALHPLDALLNTTSCYQPAAGNRIPLTQQFLGRAQRKNRSPWPMASRNEFAWTKFITAIVRRKETQFVLGELSHTAKSLATCTAAWSLSIGRGKYFFGPCSKC